MAGSKDTKLSIVIRAVDQATAPIRALNAKLARLAGPWAAIRDKASGALSAIGGALTTVGGAIGGLIKQVPLLGVVFVGTLGAATHLLMGMVEQFDELGDKAESIGVGVDFLAQMRYAAKKSGASVEELDGGLQNFTKSLGQARAGTGRMLAFVSHVSPPLAKQLKAANSNADAFDLLANAMKKLPDPARRAALAQATLGDAKLAPLLARGADGVKALRDRYSELAGPQQGAADAAGRVDDSMIDLYASVDGVKAALVEGFGPAIEIISKKLTKWISEHREDIKQWAADLGEKIPAAFQAVVAWVERAIGKVKSVVEWLGKAYDKVNAFIHLEETQKENDTRERRVKFYKQLATANGSDLSPDELDRVARLKVLQEDQIRERVKAQAAGIDWTKPGNEDKFGEAGRPTVYSPEELKALMGVLRPDRSSLGYENIPLLAQAMAARPSIAPQAGRALQSSNEGMKQALAAARDQSTIKATVEFKNAPRGTKIRAEGSEGIDLGTSVGYQMNPGAF